MGKTSRWLFFFQKKNLQLFFLKGSIFVFCIVFLGGALTGCGRFSFFVDDEPDGDSLFTEEERLEYFKGELEAAEEDLKKAEAEYQKTYKDISDLDDESLEALAKKQEKIKQLKDRIKTLKEIIKDIKAAKRTSPPTLPPDAIDFSGYSPTGEGNTALGRDVSILPASPHSDSDHHH